MDATDSYLIRSMFRAYRDKIDSKLAEDLAVLEKSATEAMLGRITRVVKSDWTADLFLSPEDVMGNLHTGVPGIVFYGELATEDLYDAIMDMIEGWPRVDDIEHSSFEWTRPA